MTTRTDLSESPRIEGREDLLAKFDAPDLVDRFQPAPAPITPDQVAMLREGAKRPLLEVQRLLRRDVG